jgi:hypothetical protein
MLRAIGVLALVLASPTAYAGDGKDFIEEAKLLYRVVACTGDDPIPADLDHTSIDAYCKRLRVSMEMYQKNYVEGAEKFIAELRPSGLPATVVYPFGGGDLLSAITTYPDAKEITTISLEHAGDPRRIRGLEAKRLAVSLTDMRSMGGGLLVWNDSKSVTLSAAQKSDLPGQVSLFLIALAVHGYKPISLKFFRLEPDGAVHYYDEAEIAALEKTKADRLRAPWTPPDFSEAFSNSEIRYVRADGKSSEIRVHRHFAANLANEAMKKYPALLKHLEAKGKVVAMTKAASYLLWQDAFSIIREYLLTHMAFMVSDSTGIPPKLAQKAGFVQDTFGTFAGSFLGASPDLNRQFREVWEKNPKRTIPFRYGYLDSSKHYHMLITRPAGPGESIGSGTKTSTAAHKR